jgi:2-polyprenyl-6-methoxyphenol hydroxylase-like FAD-dependent oxidoreductase
MTTTKHNLKDKAIAIVGGGPGGLTLARLLQMNGADVSVYERDADSSARAQGATLDLHDESGLRALREAGLMDEFMANYRPGADRLHLMDKDANSIFEENVSGEGELARPEIDRGPLQNILLASLQPGTVVWDSHFISMSQRNNVWKLDFKNGTEAFADMVIAADGANSKIRPYLTPIKPFYSGVTALEGAVYDSAINSPNVHKLLNGGKIFAFGESKSLIVSSKGDGSLVFYTSFKIHEQWVKQSGIDFTDKEQVIDWFKTDYAEWDDVWLELFENSTGSFVPRPLYCMPLDQTWEAQPNLTLLGDAAHLMPPFAGEGVNMAMLDAVELSQCLLDGAFADTHSAIAAYEKQMRTRASETAQDALVSTEALHSPNAIGFLMDMIGAN